MTAQKSQQQIRSKRAIQKTTETTGGLVGNKIAEKITKATSNITCEDQSKSPTEIYEPLIQPIGIPKEKFVDHQTDDNKLLLNFDYYNHKYIYQEWSIGKS